MHPHVFNNVMIDIETFGRRPSGLVVSIGAVCFSTDPSDFQAGRIFSGKPEHEFHAVLSLKSAFSENRFVQEAETMRWWAEQQPAAYERLLALMRESTLDVRQLMESFMQWLKPYCSQGHNVIGNSPSFDLVLIENACRHVGVNFEVPYRAETDYRSITDLVWGDAKPRAGANGAHDALFDAKFQAETYAKALHIVRGWRAAADKLAA
jgi:hypothetical protein